MADVNSSLTQLVGAYKKHLKFSQTDKKEEISHYLLLFYAVECALKAKYLKDKNSNSTEDFRLLGLSKHGYGHNLLEWQKALKMPNFWYSEDVNMPIVQMHERLRYGTFGNSQKEQDQVKFLKDLVQCFKNNL